MLLMDMVPHKSNSNALHNCSKLQLQWRKRQQALFDRTE